MRRGRRLRYGRGRILGTLGLLSGSVAVGVVAGLAVAPAATAAGAGTQRVLDMWNSMSVDVPFDASLPQRSVLVDRNGTTFATLYAEDRVPVSRAQISATFVDALISTEDARFFEHGGVDIAGTGRALLNNALGGRRQGASTITQQWIKNITAAAADTEERRLAADDLSIGRKIVEARAAVEAEQRFSKDEILTRYVNTAFYGNGAYGLGAAASRYFSTTPDQLNLNQAAILAGVLNAPGLFDPIAKPEAAAKRRNQVLERMVVAGRLDRAAADVAKAQPLDLAPATAPNGCAQSNYPQYCQWVRETVLTDPSFGRTEAARQELLYRGGLVIQTSLDPGIQQNTDAALAAALEPTNRVASAAAVIEPGSGRVLALSSNRPWGSDAAAGQSEVLYPVLPNFQPGSTFKPITLATAIEQGFDSKTVWAAPQQYAPADLNSPEGGFTNAGDGPGGVMNAEEATWRSTNTYYVRLIEQTGVIPVAKMAQRLGMTSIRTEGEGAVGARDASLTLGDFNTSPLQVANVYATFASGGVRCNPIGVTGMVRDGTEELPVATADCSQAIDPAIAAKVNTILTGVVDGPDGSRTGAKMSIGRPVTGKTGTAGDFAATWFAGASPQIAAAVWVGDPRGGPANPLRDVTAFAGEVFPQVFGGTIAGPTWQRIMSTSLSAEPVAQFPPSNRPALPAVTVPNVVGLPLEAAVGALTAAGFPVTVAPGTASLAQPTPPNFVVQTDPPAGTPRVSGTPVVVTLSPGSRTDVEIRQAG